MKYLLSMPIRSFKPKLTNSRAVELDLTEVSDVKLYPHQEEFAIVFRGPLDKFLGQGLRSFSHDQMGQFEMFLVPIKQDEQGFRTMKSTPG